VQRAQDVAGLDALYADKVVRWLGNTVGRAPGMLDCHPTCFQAEVLYPSAVSTDNLQRIYVKTDTDQSEVVGFLKATFHRDIEVLIAPHKFDDRVS